MNHLCEWRRSGCRLPDMWLPPLESIRLSCVRRCSFRSKFNRSRSIDIGFAVCVLTSAPFEERQMKTVMMHGEMWARNLSNINLIPSSRKPGGRGVYILYDGSMPVYVGKGNMRSRIKSARLSKNRGQLWDHFSWYSLNPKITHDIEALILRMLP